MDRVLATEPPETEAQPDPARVLAVLGAFVSELRSVGAAPRVSLDSVLDRDLGLDSVSRAELLARLEQELGVHGDEVAVLRAVSVRDLIEALGRISGAPGPSLATLDVVQPTEGSPTRVALDVETLIDALEVHARVEPERVHAYLLDAAADQQVLRYGELARGARMVAAGMREQGVGPGECVALMLPTGADYLRCFLGALLAGAVPVPLYPPARLTDLDEHLARQQRILESCAAVLLVSVREAMPVARALKRVQPSLRAVVTARELADAGESRALATVARRSEDIALVQYTSGSTGDPKGVLLSHRNLLSNIRAMGAALAVTADDVMVSWLPLYHDMGLIGCWLSALYFGFPIVLMSPLSFLASPRRWLWAIHRAKGTLSCAPNFGYELCVRRLSDADVQGLDLSSWRFALNGSEPVSARTMDRFATRFAPYGFRRAALFPAYGLAECSVALTFPPLLRGPRVDVVSRDALLRMGRAVPAADHADAGRVTSFVSCGRPVAGHEVRVIDATGQECPDRTVGDIEFRGPSATRGYLGRDDATRALFHGSWLRTGDLGYIADGELHVTGRRKDLIIRGGRHLYPQEIEEAVGELSGARKGCVAAFAATDLQLGTERLVVAVETRETGEARAALARQIDVLVTTLLGAPPEDVVLLAPHSIPKTSSGKLRRSACRAAYEDGTLAKPSRGALLTLARVRLRGVVPELRRWLFASVELAYAAYAWTVFALVAVTSWLTVMLLPRLACRFVVARSAARALSVLTATRVSVEGRDRLPTGPCVIVANHESNIDPFVLFGVLPVRFSIVVKSELREHWWTRLPLDRLDVEYVRRDFGSEGLADARRIMGRTRGDRVPVFFAEGTHSRVPGLLPFRMGAFVTAAAHDLPVVPIVLTGTRSILRSDTWMPRRGSITVTVGNPIVAQGRGFDAAVELARATRTFMLERTREPDLA